jgi:hypothetical protein
MYVGESVGENVGSSVKSSSIGEKILDGVQTVQMQQSHSNNNYLLSRLVTQLENSLAILLGQV